jgi:hypothetical protein
MGEEHQGERDAKKQRGIVDEQGVLHRGSLLWCRLADLVSSR